MIVFLNKLEKNPHIVILAISITRFQAEKARIKLKKMGIRVGIIHLFWLKPFILSSKIIKYLNTSKFGLLITDNDYVDGIARTIAHKISIKSGKKAYVLGLLDRTAGHHAKVDNLPPDASKITNKILNIIKSK